MSIASQITTMQEHIEDIYDTFAVAGVDTSAAAKNIVNINANLKERLEYYLANGLDVVWNNWNKVSGSGTTLSLNNTIQAKMDFIYKGNTSQESTNNQLYLTSVNDDSGAWNIKHPTITNGIINIQGQNTEGTENSSYKNGYFNVSNVNWKTNTTYYISCKIDIISNPRNVSSFSALAYGQGGGPTGATLIYNSQTQRYICSVTTGSTIINNRKDLEIRVEACEINISEISVKETADYTFDGYGPSPTPEYPSLVNVVTGDNEVKVEGKNLFDENDNSITLDNRIGQDGRNYQEIGQYISPFIKVKPNTQYTKNSPIADAYHRFAFYTDTRVSSENIISISSENTITTPVNCNYLRFCGLQSELNTTMLVQGSATGNYVPYKEQTYPITLSSKNLFSGMSSIGSGSSYENNILIIPISNSNISNIINVDSSTPYTLSLNSSNSSTRIYIVENNANGERVNTLTNYSRPYTFTTTANTKTIDIRFSPSSSESFPIAISQIMLEKGLTASEYQPYNPNPIELCKIGDYQDYIAKSTGKNLINSLEYHRSCNSNNGNIATPVSSPEMYLGIEDYVNVKPNTTYTVSFQHDDLTASLYIGTKDINGNFIERINLGVTRTFTTGSNVYQIFIFIYKSGGNFTIGGWTQLEYGSTPTTYEPYGTGWYKYGAIGKVVLDGSENWGADEQGGYNNYKIILNDALGGDTIITCLSNYFKGVTGNQSWSGNIDNAIGIGSSKTLRFRRTTFATTNDFKTWLTTHNTTVYYVLNTPTVTEITDTTLINQLEAIKLSYNEQTNISQTNTDKPFILDVTALKDLDAEDTTPALTTNRGLLFTQPPVSENFINDEDDNSILEEIINEEEPNIENDNREEEESVDFFEKEIINNDEEQEEMPTEPIEVDNGQR